MIIIGIDPGSRFCGFGFIQIKKRKIFAAGYDTLKLKPALSLPEKLVEIKKKLNSIISEIKPDKASVEGIFYGKNVKSSFVLAHVRGAILLTLQEAGIEIHEFAPKEIKLSITGSGKAKKEQINYVVKKLLKFNDRKISYDSSDALAAAICLHNKQRFNKKI